MDISIAFATPFEQRTEWQKTLTRNGLCYAGKMLVDKKQLSYSEHTQIVTTIDTFGIPLKDGYLYPTRNWVDFDPKYDTLRAAIAERISVATTETPLKTAPHS